MSDVNLSDILCVSNFIVEKKISPNPFTLTIVSKDTSIYCIFKVQIMIR